MRLTPPYCVHNDGFAPPCRAVRSACRLRFPVPPDSEGKGDRTRIVARAMCAFHAWLAAVYLFVTACYVCISRLVTVSFHVRPVHGCHLTVPFVLFQQWPYESFVVCSCCNHLNYVFAVGHLIPKEAVNNTTLHVFKRANKGGILSLSIIQMISEKTATRALG